MGPDLLEALRRRQGQLLDLLAELVSIPSHASQPAGVREVGERMAGRLRAIGFSAERVTPTTPQSTPAWAVEVLSGGVPVDDLVGPSVWRRAGERPGELLVLGDLDAALALPAGKSRLELRAGRAIGPAVADMKGGLVVLVGALEALTELGAPLPSITVVLSGDEQAGSILSRHTIEERARVADWCLCLECARDGGFLMGSRGHIGVGRIRADGVEAHAGSALASGINAIDLLVEALARLADRRPAPGEGIATVTMIRGGQRRSLVPGDASAILDLRAASPREWRALERRLSVVGAGTSRPERVSVETHSHRPALKWTPLTDWFLDVVRRAGTSLAIDVAAIRSMAAGSSAFVDSRRVAVLDGMGPVGGGLMTADEHVEVESLVTRAALLAATVATLELPPPSPRR
ncbi:MAG TPA: M20/M25/M40 family metallo-hydrolase [Candidatus Limnocylindria bacterium]|nr:M20/M25/M40 family metallo-hydrolase [Candidatus Limnocylindria bacterium]